MKCIEDEIPFEVPTGWGIARISSLSTIVTDGEHKTPIRCNVYKGYYLLSARNIQNGYLSLDDVDYVDEEEFSKISKRCNPKKNDILISCSGSVGRVTVVKDENNYVMVRSAAMVRFIEIIPLFAMYTLQTVYLQLQIQQASKQTAQANLFQGAILNLLMPIPPLAEQDRIAKRVFDLLEQVNLIESDNMEIGELIKNAKSKILGLAIRGKLVPQDPNDEPASILLERIRAEKEELIKQGKIKRDKKASVIFKGEDNSYYQQTGTLIENLNDWDLEEIPDNWELCCLSELCDYGNCTNVDANNIADDAWILDLEDIEKDTGRILQKIKKANRDSSSTKHLFRKGQVLYSKLRPYLNKVVIADEDGFCTSEILPLDFSAIVEPQYALYYLMSPTFLKYANRCSYGVKMPRLGTADGKKAVFLLPPIKEQQRIAQHILNIFAKMDIIANALA